MVRKKRIIHAGSCYHVMIRGVGGRNIFTDDRDRSRFCLLLQYAVETCKISVHGFCLMNNHVHLILQPHTSDLSSGMHLLTFRYAQYFNAKVDHQGYLFQGRFKSICVERGIYLRRLIRYIHHNPVRANLVDTISRYPWSSHLAYIGKSKFTWLETEMILKSFGSEPSYSLSAYEKYISKDDVESKSEIEEIRNSMGIGAYGNELFIKEFQETLKSSLRKVNSYQLNGPESYFRGQKISLETLLKAHQTKTTVSLEEMRSSSRKVQFVDARAIFVQLILSLGICTRSEASTLLCRDPTSISRLEERALLSKDLQDVAEEVKNTLRSDSRSLN